MDLSARLEDIHRRLGLIQDDVLFLACNVPSKTQDPPKTKQQQFAEIMAEDARRAAEFAASGGLSVPPLTTEQADVDSTTNQPKEEDFEDRHRIGVFDYPSCVSELRNWYTQLFPGRPLTDPQDMIQLFAAEIQNLRRSKDA